MKIAKLSSLIVTLFILLPTLSVGAATYDPFGTACQGVSDSAVCDDAKDTTNPISGENGVILQAVSILSWAIGVISVLMVMFGGMKYITSNGDPNAITNAKNTVLYAIIGAVVFLLSQAIIAFVIRRL